MNNEAFLTAYNQSRNGCNFFVRHPLVRNFQYSDGVRECAEAGCYWLLDILATEVPAKMRATGNERCLIEVSVSKAAELSATVADDALPIWSRKIEFTDMPDGDYVFELVDEGERFALCLITEH